ncbi:MAG: phosphoribosylanthranilate isomerase [Magnetococcales bacterium]|nr:phosphoribosylanthranilate isomerase [Magnetococcales bacterium]
MGKTQVKVCGLTRRVDVEAAVAAGADALGLVFYPKSPRFVTPAEAAALVADLPPFVVRVGLFVNASCAEIVQTVGLGWLDCVQLHGDETPAFCRQLRLEMERVALFPRLIKAVRVATREDVQTVAQWPVQAILLDAKVESRYGGTGRSFDWSLLEGWPRLFAASGAALPLILAGGLTPDNVALAVRQVRPYAVDVSSGVETAPGIKCANKIIHFIRQVQQADLDQPNTPDATQWVGTKDD